MSSAGRDVLRALAWVLASATATLALVQARGPDPEPFRSERRPLSFTSSSEACETCHARQASEWRRSVMAHSLTSPLFQSLELLIQEQVGRSAECPEGAGVLRRLDRSTACRDRNAGPHFLTGNGGEGWCVNCHAPGVNLDGTVPAWDARVPGPDNRALAELLPARAREGIGCTVCHQVHGPARPGAPAEYQGNSSWISAATGAVFDFRATASERAFGIGNSGYRLAREVLLADFVEQGALVPGGAHRRLDPDVRAYLSSSEFCGACHDVRLFGSDVIGSRRGEHFKRLRNAYSEWRDYRDRLARRGETAASCQDCHMSSFPRACEPSGARGTDGTCPPGTTAVKRPPGSFVLGPVAVASHAPRPVRSHYFSGVDVPLGAEFAGALIDEPGVDAAGLPLSARARRDLLLVGSVSLELGTVARRGDRLSIPLTLENRSAGHRIPAGFSQERELWVHLRVTDERGRVVYEVGRVERADEDLADKRFLRVSTDDTRLDALGRPIGLFGADVDDGPDVPRWDPPPDLGGTRFRGRGLINFQNGFLRCVSCLGRIDARGHCQPLSGQERPRSARYEDGVYDPDTGACRSNLSGQNALFETYFPIGALDASRGVVKAPDAIMDTRSLAPETPVTYVFELDAPRGEVNVEARLLFRAFPPYLLRAFADYERSRAAQGRRPGGALIDERALARLEVVEIARVRARGGSDVR
jgi:hypothetical protein